MVSQTSQFTLTIDLQFIIEKKIDAFVRTWGYSWICCITPSEKPLYLHNDLSANPQVKQEKQYSAALPNSHLTFWPLFK